MWERSPFWPRGTYLAMSATVSSRFFFLPQGTSRERDANCKTAALPLHLGKVEPSCALTWEKCLTKTGLLSTYKVHSLAHSTALGYPIIGIEPYASYQWLIVGNTEISKCHFGFQNSENEHLSPWKTAKYSAILYIDVQCIREVYYQLGGEKATNKTIRWDEIQCWSMWNSSTDGEQSGSQFFEGETWA